MNNPLKTQAPKEEKNLEPEAPATVSYSSHPIENFSLGSYRFEKGLLTLDSEAAAEFDKLIESLPPMEQTRIKKLDVAAAEQFVRQLLENQQAAATQVTDSSTGERARPVIGTGKLEDSNPASDGDSQ